LAQALVRPVLGPPLPRARLCMGQVSGRFEKSKLITTYTGAFSDKYEIIRKIGEGAGGKAYIVESRKDGSLRVAKEAADDDNSEILEEFKWMRELDHPNIAKVYELVDGNDWVGGTQQQRTLVISEFAPGLDLFKYTKKLAEHMLRTNGAITEEWISRIFRQVMLGVAYLHGKGVWHNDLKPDNFLMLQEFDPGDPKRVPMVVVTDFGRAQKANASIQLGDPRYQSPQKWLAYKELSDLSGPLAPSLESGEGRAVDGTSDVWSMGASLFEVVNGGSIAFLYEPCTLDRICRSETENRLFSNVCGIEEISHCEGTSAQASDLIGRMLNKSSALRPSATQVLEHEWFNVSGTGYVKGHALTRYTSLKLHLTAMKREAHAILLEAVAAKIQRKYYMVAYNLFSSLDEDRDGVLSLEEFSQALIRLGRDDHDAKKIFDAADTDKSNNLTFNEFLAVTFDWQSVGKEELERCLGQVFDEIDNDNSGYIDEKELGNFFKGVLRQAQIKETFRLISDAGTGRITKTQLHHFLFEPMTDEDLAKYCERMDKAPVECCERVEGESLAAIGCLGLGAFVHPCTTCGQLACFAGIFAGIMRYEKTPAGRNFFASRKALKVAEEKEAEQENKATEAARTAEAKKAQEAAKATETKRASEAKEALTTEDAKKAEETAKAAETKRAAEAAEAAREVTEAEQAMQAARAAEVLSAAEAKKAEEEKKAAEAATGIAAVTKAQEMAKAAETKTAAEAPEALRIAEAKKVEETVDAAEAKRAAEAAVSASEFIEAEQAAQTARDAEISNAAEANQPEEEKKATEVAEDISTAEAKKAQEAAKAAETKRPAEAAEAAREVTEAEQATQAARAGQAPRPNRPRRPSRQEAAGHSHVLHAADANNA